LRDVPDGTAGNRIAAPIITAVQRRGNRSQRYATEDVSDSKPSRRSKRIPSGVVSPCARTRRCAIARPSCRRPPRIVPTWHARKRVVVRFAHP